MFSNPQVRALLAAALLVLIPATSGCPSKRVGTPADGGAATADAGRGADAGYARRCPDLPDRRPPDLVIRYSIHDYERPENLVRWVLHDDAATCPPDEMSPHLLGYYKPRICVPLAAADFDRLFGELRAAGIDRIRARPVEPGPHTAGRLVDLSWAGNRCSVGRVLRMMEIAPEQSDAMYRCTESIAATIRTALAASRSPGPVRRAPRR